MKAKVINIHEQPAKANSRASKCYIIVFKGEDGKSYRSWTDDAMGNFKRWYNSVICGFYQCQKDNRELWLDGLTMKVKGLVDADSLFTITIKDGAPAAFLPDHGNAGRETSGRKDLE